MLFDNAFSWLQFTFEFMFEFEPKYIALDSVPENQKQ